MVLLLRVQTSKFLGLHRSDDLTSRDDTTGVVRRVQQRLHLLQRLKRADLSKSAMTVLSLRASSHTISLPGTGTGEKKTDRDLAEFIRTAERITGVLLSPARDGASQRTPSSLSQSLLSDAGRFLIEKQLLPQLNEQSVVAAVMNIHRFIT